MRFFRTLLQKRILKNYWKNQEPFTIDSLCAQKVVRNRLWGSFAMKMMLKKRQIMEDPGANGRQTYIGTTDSKEEWEQLVREKKIARNPFIIVEDFGLSGMNKYEKDKAIDELIKMIEESELFAQEDTKSAKGS